ncbi:MAG: outer membrane protein assembly factor BamB family protein [Planctomycetota bacterium]|jgi:outer membrane protein assembly factor BamB
MRLTVVGAVLLVLPACSSAWAEQSAEDVLKASGIKGGLVVQLGCGDGTLTTALGADDALIVQGLDTDPTNVEKARAHIQSLGLGGKVSAAVFDGQRLPYVDNLVNLVVASGECQVTSKEIARVLAPNGVALVPADSPPAPAAGRSPLVPREVTGLSGWVALVKPWPDEIDEWTHFLHGPDNNAVSRDLVVGPPRCLQWVSDPVYGRHHDRLASISAMVTAGGRLFSIEDRGPALSMGLPPDWRLIARDAFNGVTLWELPIHQWQSTRTGFRSGPVQLPRRLVAVGDRVYVALNYGGPLLCLDAATGATLGTFEATEGVTEILYGDGILYLVASAAEPENGRRILAVSAQSGEILWENQDGPARSVLPATLAVGDGSLFFHDGQAVVALDRANGRVGWRRPVPTVSKRPPWSSPTIVFHDGVVLCGDRAVDYPASWKQHEGLLSGMLQHGGLGLLTALSADRGEVLWQDEASECFHGAVDVFVIDGLVWASRGPARFFFERTRPILAEEVGEDFYIENVTGRDLRTGAVRKTIDAAEAFTLSHHHRCFRNKATGRYIIMGRTGIELINLTGGPSLRHNWTRGACQYGVMPANGLLYTPPHPCACYNASKMNGFFAYSSRKEAAWTGKTIVRLHKGPAYNELQISHLRPPASSLQPPASSLQPDVDWPTYRHDNARSGCGGAPVADRVAVAWRRDLPGKLSAPTSADGKVFVAAIDRHTVYALDLATGNELWSYTTGGRVDSPPTYWQGRVYFGSADGSIRCLNATDGVLIWRFFAAPQQTSIVAWDQLESPWPVAGSVLVREGAVYALAGRSSNLDGGMYFIKLDASTGKPQLTKQIYSRDPNTGRQAEQRIDNLYMPGLLYDVPSSTGSSIFVREARLSLDGTTSDEPQQHLYNTGGFLDDTWWHRYYMVYGTRFKNGPGGGAGRSGGAPSGRLLVCDGKRVYGYGHARDNRYRLLCDATGAVKPPPPKALPKGRKVRKGRATSSATIWSDSECPMMVRAMVLARAPDSSDMDAGRLVLAGPPATAFASIEALRGAEGGLLAVVDASTGQSLSQTSIEAPPVFDGMCVAQGRVVLSLTSGAVVSFK